MKMTCAAIKMPDGTIHTGAAHYLIDILDEEVHGAQYGFLGADDRFYTRDEAAALCDEEQLCVPRRTVIEYGLDSDCVRL